MNLGPKRGPIAATHFTYEEALNKSGYTRVPLWMVPGVIRHAKNLDRLRARLNEERRARGFQPTSLSVISWIRSPEHNREVGGARFSKHMLGIATDISREEVARVSPWKGGAGDFDRVADKVFKRGGFGTYSGGARHVDSRRTRARWTTWRPG